MNQQTMINQAKKSAILASIVAVFLLAIGCGDGNQLVQKTKLEIRREKVLKLIEGKCRKSNVILADRFVADIRLDRKCTTLERRGWESEEGAYDTIWVPSQQGYYFYVEYRFISSYRDLDFVAAWPMRDGDTLPVKYVLTEWRKPYNTDTIVTVATNLEFSNDIEQVAGHTVDTLQQRQSEVTVSFSLLGYQPWHFFYSIRLDGKPLSAYSPSMLIRMTTI